MHDISMGGYIGPQAKCILHLRMLDNWVPFTFSVPTIPPLQRISKEFLPTCLSLACWYCWSQFSTLRSASALLPQITMCPKPCNSRVSPWHPAITLKNWWTNQIEELGTHKLPKNSIVTINGKITQCSKTFLLTKVHSLESHIYLSTTLLFTMLNSTSFFIRDIVIQKTDYWHHH
jgi:hypothetical protein